MSILAFPRRAEPADPAPQLALFPLNAVLFPGGTLSLKVFEPRYMTLVKSCFKDESGFGVCLIAEGEEVGAPAVPHAIGTEARIVAWDMTRPGILDLSVRGESRFRILERQTEADGLQQARIEPLTDETGVPVPRALRALVALLKAMVADLGEARLPLPHRYEDALWVGYRFCELLPIPTLARQKLLELDDPVSRLEIVFKYLAQRNLVN